MNFSVVWWLLDKDKKKDYITNESFTDWFLNWFDWFIKKKEPTSIPKLWLTRLSNKLIKWISIVLPHRRCWGGADRKPEWKCVQGWAGPGSRSSPGTSTACHVCKSPMGRPGWPPLIEKWPAVKETPEGSACCGRPAGTPAWSSGDPLRRRSKGRFQRRPLAARRKWRNPPCWSAFELHPPWCREVEHTERFGPWMISEGSVDEGLHIGSSWRIPGDVL